MSHWWRAHDDSVDNPKLGLLSDRLFRCWYNLNCLASANGGKLPAIGVVAFKLRLTEHKAAEIITALVQAKLIDRTEDGFAPHNWNERQFKSDVTDGTNAERQQRYRNRHRNGATVTPTVTVTATREQITDTETDSEKKETRARRALPSGWPPDYRDKFWEAFPNKVGKADALAKLDRVAFSGKTEFFAIMSALDRYARKTDDRPFCNPATWINQERWTDEPAQQKAYTNGARPDNSPAGRERAVLAGLGRAFGAMPRDGQMAEPPDAEIPLGRVNIDG